MIMYTKSIFIVYKYLANHPKDRTDFQKVPSATKHIQVFFCYISALKIVQM